MELYYNNKYNDYLFNALNYGVISSNNSVGIRLFCNNLDDYIYYFSNCICPDICYDDKTTKLLCMADFNYSSFINEIIKIRTQDLSDKKAHKLRKKLYKQLKK
jgi:hypothetical protein